MRGEIRWSQGIESLFWGVMVLTSYGTVERGSRCEAQKRSLVGGYMWYKSENARRVWERIQRDDDEALMHLDAVQSTTVLWQPLRPRAGDA
jgi:hypothetical protein